MYFSINFSCYAWRSYFKASADETFCATAVQNNSTTYHFQKLVHHVMELLARADKVRDRAQHAANAVYFLRIFVKHLTENLSAAHLISFVNEVPQSQLSNGTAGTHTPSCCSIVQPFHCLLATGNAFNPHTCSGLVSRCGRLACSPAGSARPVTCGSANFGTAHPVSSSLAWSPLSASPQVPTQPQVGLSFLPSAISHLFSILCN